MIAFKIRTKLILGFLFISMIPITILGVYTFSTYTESLVESSMALVQNDVTEHVTTVKTTLSSVSDDLLILSQLPTVQSLANIQYKSNANYLSDNSFQELKDGLTQVFLAVLEGKHYFHQIRFIDEKGDEIVRVDNNRGVIRSIPDDDLQNKSERYYFKEAIMYDEGQIYISNLDLNKEGYPPKIEIPYLPTVRYITPVINSSGEKKGVVVINVATDKVFGFAKYRHHFNEIDSFLTDSNGFYLHNQDHDKLFGSVIDLDTGFRFQNDYPEAGNQVFSGEEGLVDLGDGVLIYSPIHYGATEGDYWVMFHMVPKATMLKGATSFQQLFLLAFFSTFLSILAFIYLVMKSIMAPIKKLTDNAKVYASGDFTPRIQHISTDEIGELSSSFNSMAKEINKYQDGLEKEVELRTKDLIHVQSRLEEQLHELKKFKSLTVGREIKMKDLKNQINELKDKLK